MQPGHGLWLQAGEGESSNPEARLVSLPLYCANTRAGSRSSSRDHVDHQEKQCPRGRVTSLTRTSGPERPGLGVSSLVNRGRKRRTRSWRATCQIQNCTWPSTEISSPSPDMPTTLSDYLRRLCGGGEVGWGRDSVGGGRGLEGAACWSHGVRKNRHFAWHLLHIIESLTESQKTS